MSHSFDELWEKHGVAVRFSKDLTKASLNYDQIHAKSGDRLAEECRGLVIRPLTFGAKCLLPSWKDQIVGECQLVAWPMNRFYNLGDPKAATIDWSSGNVSVQEKLDGTMIVAYWDSYKKRWCAATRSVPEADLPICEGHLEIGNSTFSDLFLRALIATREEHDGKPLGFVPKCPGQVVSLSHNTTYVFELTSQFNRIVVRYDEPRVTLLAARSLTSGEELDTSTLLPQVRKPKKWELTSSEHVKAFVATQPPEALEGAVVSDGKGRVKVKSEAWVLSSRMKEMVHASPRRILEAIINETIDDVLPLVEPSIVEKVLKMQDEFRTYVQSVDARFAEMKAEATDRKHFASMVMLSDDIKAPYFAMWEGKATSMLEWLKGQKQNHNLFDQVLVKIG